MRKFRPLSENLEGHLPNWCVVYPSHRSSNGITIKLPFWKRLASYTWGCHICIFNSILCGFLECLLTVWSGNVKFSLMLSRYLRWIWCRKSVRFVFHFTFSWSNCSSPTLPFLSILILQLLLLDNENERVEILLNYICKIYYNLCPLGSSSQET